MIYYIIVHLYEKAPSEWALHLHYVAEFCCGSVQGTLCRKNPWNIVQCLLEVPEPCEAGLNRFRLIWQTKLSARCREQAKPCGRRLA